MKGYTRVLNGEYRRLSMIEHGAYVLIVDAIHEKGAFPTRSQALAWSMARNDEEIRAVDFVLNACFEQEDGVYSCKGIKKQLRKSQRGKKEVQKDLFEGASGEEFIRIPAAGGKNYVVKTGDLEELRKLYPSVNVEQVLREIADWNANNPPKTVKGMPRHIKGWLSRESKRNPGRMIQNAGVPMTDSWRPSEEAYSILSSQGVPINFAQDAVPEFVLYWKQTGQVRATWDSAFICRVKSQWDRQKTVSKNESSDDWTELLSNEQYGQLIGGRGQEFGEQAFYEPDGHTSSVAKRSIRGKSGRVAEALQVPAISRFR